jgi:hypothetical protein
LYFWRHLVRRRAAQCWTRAEGFWRPFERWFLRRTVGNIFSIIAVNGGGVAWYWVSSVSSLKEEVGTGMETIDPASETFDSHLEDKRGSSVKFAPLQ